MAPNSGLVANLTTEGAVVCQRCNVSYPRGTILQNVRDPNPKRPGRLCCENCISYYKLKSSGTTVLKVSDPGPALDTVQQGVKIHKNNVDSQRGAGSKKIVSIGQPGSMGPPKTIPRGPRVVTPFSNNRHLAGSLLDSFLAQVKNKNTTEGYQPNHDHYDLFRAHMQTQAYTTGRTDNFSLKAQLVTLDPKKNTGAPSTVGPGGCVETIGYIPTYAGVRDLKFIALTAIYPAFKAWSRNYPLTLDDVQLRRKTWVEMIAVNGFPDVDAVKDECYTTGKNPKLKANAVVHVYLYLNADIYSKIEDHIAKIEERELQAEENSKNLNHRPSKRRKSDSPNDDDLSMDYDMLKLQTSSAPSLSKSQRNQQSSQGRTSSQSAGICQPTLPTVPRSIHVASSTTSRSGSQQLTRSRSVFEGQRDKLMAALNGVEKIPSAAVGEFLGNNIQVPVQVYFVSPETTLQDLLDDSDLLKEPWCSNAFATKKTILEFPENPDMKHGAFKTAFKAYSSEPLFATSTRVVCLKQAYHLGTDRSVRVSEPGAQVQGLAIELSCLIWARFLLEFVDDHVNDLLEDVPFPDGPIPSFRFVNAGLAISKDREHVYLVEEYIPQKEGVFRKYINNKSAEPLFETLPEAYHQQAKFLAFSQHFQYTKTEGLAYISDLQGSQFTLTDPQVITKKKKSFAKGNVNHANFQHEHICNEYCEWYGLLPFEDAQATALQEEAQTQSVQSQVDPANPTPTSNEPLFFPKSSSSNNRSKTGSVPLVEYVSSNSESDDKPRRKQTPSKEPKETAKPSTSDEPAMVSRSGEVRVSRRGRGRGGLRGASTSHAAANASSQRVLRSSKTLKKAFEPPSGSDMDISMVDMGGAS